MIMSVTPVLLEVLLFTHLGTVLAFFMSVLVGQHVMQAIHPGFFHLRCF